MHQMCLVPTSLFKHVGTTAAKHAHQTVRTTGGCVLVQETAGLLTPDAGSSKTAVAVAIAKLGEPAVVTQFAGGGSFIGTGRALSAAAGRLSYMYGLKASVLRSASSYHVM